MYIYIYIYMCMIFTCKCARMSLSISYIYTYIQYIIYLCKHTHTRIEHIAQGIIICQTHFISMYVGNSIC